MSRPQPQSTFIVPKAVPGAPVAAPKKAAAREPTPLVIVPESFVIDDVDLEPQWVQAIESATD